MMKRMNNADFHKFLTEFSDAVAQGKYKKMPYDKYRELRKIKNVSVDIYVNTYTNYREERISRIIVAPYGPVIYEFDMHDGSFGNFCYDYLKKEEPKVHPNEKKQYDIYGNVIDYCDYQTKCDKIDNTAKEAFLDYCTAKATGDSLTAINTSCVCNTVNADKAGISWSDSISTSDSTRCTTATIATPAYVETKTLVDVLQEDVEDLKKLVEGNNCEIATKANLNDVNRDIDALGDAIGETNIRIDECEYDLRERIEEARTAAIEESWYTRAELEQMVNERIKALEDKFIGVHIVPVDELITQSTSSDCYPVKNFKLNVAAWDTPCSDDRKEKENMDTNKMFNFDFGPVASHVRMSPYGLAIKSADNKFVSYDKASGSVVDVEVFNFDAQKFLYKMPVPVSQVAVGDVVVHMRKPMFVREVKGNVVSVVDIYNAEAKDILPVKSPFGFNFITKIVSLIDMSGADANSPFGNMLPLLMMGENQDFKDILPMMFFMNGNNANMMNDPLMMYALMNNTNNVDSLGFFLALSAGMGGNNPFVPATPAHTCDHNHHQEENHQ